MTAALAHADDDLERGEEDAASIRAKLEATTARYLRLLTKENGGRRPFDPALNYFDLKRSTRRFLALLRAEVRPPLPPPRSGIGRVAFLVADRFELDLPSLFVICRERRITKPRQIAMYLAHTVLGLDQSLISRYFKQDHSTTNYAVAAIAEQIITDEELGDTVEQLRQKISDGVR
jgi:hypothetical protein